MKNTFGINPIVIKETKKAIWTYQNRDLMNEVIKVQGRKLQTKNHGSSSFNFWHQKLKTQGTRLLRFNFWHRKLNPRSSMLLVYNFWNKKLKTQRTGLSVSTFGDESWRPRSKCYWSSTFNAKSWRPRTLKVGYQVSNAFGPQLLASKVESQDSLQLALNFWHQKLRTNARLDSIFRH